MPSLLLALFLASSVAVPVAAASRVLLPETAVSSPVIGNSGRAILYSYGPTASIASNGTMAVAVWQERRGANQNDVFAARIDANGTVLDPTGIALTTTPGFEEAPRVAWNGSAFVVAWTRVEFPEARSVWLAEIGTDGTLVRQPARIADGSIDAFAIAHGVTAIAIRSGGPFLAPITVLLIQPGDVIARVTPGTGTMTALTPTSSGFGVVWLAGTGTENQILAARLSPAGTIETAAQVVVTLPWIGLYSIASIGDDLIIGVGGPDIRVMRWHNADAQTIASAPFSSDFGAVGGAIVSGSTIAIGGSDPNGSFVLKFTQTGALIESIPLQGPAAIALVDLGGRLYAERATDSPAANVFGGFAGSGQTPTVLSRSADAQIAPAIASDGEHLLIVWQELRDVASSGVRGVLATLGGTPIGEPFQIFPSASNSGEFAVAFDGQRYLVVSQQYSRPTEELYYDLVATHVSRDGVPQGDRFPISSTANVHSSPRVIATPQGPLIAWIDGYYAAPVAQYAFVGSDTIARTDLGPSNVLAVTWSGANLLTVTAHDQLQVGRPGAGVSETIPVSNTVANIASNGDGALLVYRDRAGVMALPLDRDGHRTGEPKLIRAIAPREAIVDNINMSWDGFDYVVGWDERPLVGGYAQSFLTAYGAVIDRDGNARVSPFALQPSALHSTAAFPFGLGNGRSIWAYSRLAPEVTGTDRAFTRLLVPQPKSRAVRR